MKKTLIIFLLLLMWTGLKAGDLVLEAGSSWSYFRNEGGTSYPKPCLGAGFQFYPIPEFNGFWSIGLTYLRKKMVLENKSWPTNVYDLNDSDVIIGNIIIDHSFLEVPLEIGYQINLKSRWKSVIFIGGSMAIPFINNSKVKRVNEIILERGDKGNYNYDYFKVDEPVVNRSKNLNLGLQIFNGSFGFELIYIHAMETTKSLIDLTLKDYVDSFRVLICYRLKDFTSANLK